MAPENLSQLPFQRVWSRSTTSSSMGAAMLVISATRGRTSRGAASSLLDMHYWMLLCLGLEREAEREACLLRQGERRDHRGGQGEA
mmetsp:Transcript_8428/g.19767  ORF Transcript_8428/g.19767 Transcript_8428/m.19767 type:complete len:86 (+) Transcript_8428:1-258(+)